MYFMMLSYSFTTCSKIDTFLTILDPYLLFFEPPFLLGDNSVDFVLGSNPRAEEMGVGAVCFFLDGYSAKSRTVSCCEVLKVVLSS